MEDKLKNALVNAIQRYRQKEEAKPYTRGLSEEWAKRLTEITENIDTY